MPRPPTASSFRVTSRGLAGGGGASGPPFHLRRSDANGQRLLENRSNPGARNKDKKTPLDLTTDPKVKAALSRAEAAEKQ